MGEEYLIDSNVVIDFCNAKLPIGGRNLLFTIKRPIISVITHIETLGFAAIEKNEEKYLNDFISIAHIIPLDLQVSIMTIKIKQRLRIKLPDAVIAATALVYNLILVTRNTDDFKNIAGLKLMNPWLI
jgi:predicted nucleic acid-binding protein